MVGLYLSQSVEQNYPTYVAVHAFPAMPITAVLDPVETATSLVAKEHIGTSSVYSGHTGNPCAASASRAKSQRP